MGAVIGQVLGEGLAGGGATPSPLSQPTTRRRFAVFVFCDDEAFRLGIFCLSRAFFEVATARSRAFWARLNWSSLALTSLSLSLAIFFNSRAVLASSINFFRRAILAARSCCFSFFGVFQALLGVFF